MADQYHINPETGQVGRCYARLGPCPFGEAADHYPSAEAGRAAYEERQREELFASTVSKKPPAYGKPLVPKERLRELQEEGFEFNSVGEVSYRNATDWGERVVVKSSRKGPAIELSEHTPHRFSIEEHAPGVFALRHDTWQGPLTTAEARAYADELDHSRLIARQALQAAERAEEVRREVYGPAPEEKPIVLQSPPPYSPTPFPQRGYTVHYSPRGTVAEELTPEPHEERIGCTVLVDDDPRQGLYVRIRPDYYGKLNDVQVQELVYSLRRGFLTSREVEAIHMERP